MTNLYLKSVDRHGLLPCIDTAFMVIAARPCWAEIDLTCVVLCDNVSVKSLLGPKSWCPKKNSRWWCSVIESLYGLLAFCERNTPFSVGFPLQKVIWSFDIPFVEALIKLLIKQSIFRWYETWRSCEDTGINASIPQLSVGNIALGIFSRARLKCWNVEWSLHR